MSSTSVYADCCDFVTEESITNSNSVAGDLLRDAENVILSVPSIRSTVIRLAGLIGPGRHPARFFAGRKDIPNGRAPVNLIHLDDCIGIVKAVLRGDFEGEIMNACAPDHPSRQEFYTLASKSAGLSLPIFKDELLDWKIVTTNKVDIRLQYQFKVRDLMSWLRRTGTI